MSKDLHKRLEKLRKSGLETSVLQDESELGGVVEQEGLDSSVDLPASSRRVFGFFSLRFGALAVYLVLLGMMSFGVWQVVEGQQLRNVDTASGLYLDTCEVGVSGEGLSEESVQSEELVDTMAKRWFVESRGINIYCFEGQAKILREADIYVLPVENLVVQTDQILELVASGEQGNLVQIPTQGKFVYVYLLEEDLLVVVSAGELTGWRVD